MPRDVITTVYKYEELSEVAKKTARESWRRLTAESGDKTRLDTRL